MPALLAALLISLSSGGLPVCPAPFAAEATGERFNRAVGMVLPFGMSLMLSLTLLLWGGGLVVWLTLLWKAYQGETLSLPVIGK